MSATATQPDTAAEGAPSAIKKVLIVDDEKAMQMLACTIVDKLGYESAAASSGEEAVELIKEAFENEDPFSMIVMDLALPGGMSGLEATLAIKQIDPDAEVIVSSGYLEQNARDAALEHGFAGILPKPYTADRLASELRWVMKRKEERS